MPVMLRSAWSRMRPITTRLTPVLAITVAAVRLRSRRYPPAEIGAAFWAQSCNSLEDARCGYRELVHSRPQSRWPVQSRRMPFTLPELPRRSGWSLWARQDCVVDGDTIWYGGLKIRLADIDAPEISEPKCASEATLGHRAKRRLFELINSGPIEIVRTGRDEDRYGRKLRVVMQNGRSLGEILVAEGLARRWDGARRSWCDASLTSRLVTARFETRLIG